MKFNCILSKIFILLYIQYTVGWYILNGAKEAIGMNCYYNNTIRWTLNKNETIDNLLMTKKCKIFPNFNFDDCFYNYISKFNVTKCDKLELQLKPGKKILKFEMEIPFCKKNLVNLKCRKNGNEIKTNRNIKKNVCGNKDCELCISYHKEHCEKCRKSIKKKYFINDKCDDIEIEVNGDKTWYEFV